MHWKSIFLIFCLVGFHCSNPASAPNNNTQIETIYRATKTINDWLIYQYRYLDFSGDFNVLDSALNPISKNEFFKLFVSGNYIPMQVVSKDSLLTYALKALPVATAGEVRDVIKQTAEIEFGHFKMEGLKLPNYRFTDMDGNVYTPEILKDKILILKCWFLRCEQCIKEIPYLNQLREKYKERKDVKYLALTLDKKEEIGKFLSSNYFNYNIIYDQVHFIQDSLKITIFPTHIIIDKQNRIVKVVNDYKRLVSAMNSYLKSDTY